jgi:serpin B
MLYNGADKETRQEMAEMLGYDKLKSYTADYSEAANQYMNANSKLLMESLRKADEKVRLDVADSIWISKNGEFNDTLEKSLLAPVRYYYDGDIFHVDFKEEKTLEALNKWVSDKTQGMIDPFIESFSDPELLRLYLVNAVYFNGEWSIPFDPAQSTKGNFNGKTIMDRVDMMSMYETDYRYLSEKGIRGIEIPYGDGRLVMNIILPEDQENQSIDEVYDALPAGEMEAFLKKLDTVGKSEIGWLELPKFELEYGLKNLNEALKNLGMEKAFLEGGADFELIGKDLYVSAVVHKAKIKVEEWGTEASAATGIEVKCTAAEPEPLNFIVDVPFICFIRDTQTDTILFMGEIRNPRTN